MQCMHFDKGTYSSTWNCDFRPYVNSCDSTWVKGAADHDHRYHMEVEGGCGGGAMAAPANAANGG